MQLYRSIYALLVFQSAAYAADPYGSYDSYSDGSAAAKAGTVIYNNLSNKEPLPVHGGDGDVVKGTLQNLGAGKSPKDAWRASSESASGVHSNSSKGVDK